jgi:hypothetical protein
MGLSRKRVYQRKIEDRLMSLEAQMRKNERITSWQKTVSLLALVTLTACSTVRLEYKADVTTAEGKSAKYIFKRSYPVEGPHETLCWLTGIFLGGYCWYYLVMPTQQQSVQLEADALRRIEKAGAGRDYKIQSKWVDQDSWQQMDDEIKFSMSTDDAVSNESSTAKPKIEKRN